MRPEGSEVVEPDPRFEPPREELVNVFEGWKSSACVDIYAVRHRACGQVAEHFEAQVPHVIDIRDECIASIARNDDVGGEGIPRDAVRIGVRLHRTAKGLPVQTRNDLVDGIEACIDPRRDLHYWTGR